MCPLHWCPGHSSQYRLRLLWGCSRCPSTLQGDPITEAALKFQSLITQFSTCLVLQIFGKMGVKWPLCLVDPNHFPCKGTFPSTLDLAFRFILRRESLTLLQNSSEFSFICTKIQIVCGELTRDEHQVPTRTALSSAGPERQNTAQGLRVEIRAGRD